MVWVTGASSGIGKTVVEQLALLGACIIASARNTAALQALGADLGLGLDRYRVLTLDLAATQTLAQAASDAWQMWGHIDAVVCNAGVSQRALARDTLLPVVSQIMDTNYLGTVALTLPLLNLLAPHRRLHLAVVTSVVGIIGSPLRSAYAASKHALHGFYESLAAEEWHRGLRITLAVPGYIHTQVSVNALTGNGTPQGVMDRAQAQGIAPDVCARRLLKAVALGRRRVTVAGPRERLALLLKRWAPAFLAGLLRKARVT